MKNKALTIILAIMLSLPVTAWAVDDTVEPVQDNNAQIEEVAETQQLDEDADVVEDAQKVVSPYKTPISKRKIIKRFLMAMFGVVASSLILYFGLTFYNKVRSELASNEVKTPEGETPLQTPNDIEGAVRTFLEKTKWN